MNPMRRHNKRDYRTYTKHSPKMERFLHFIYTTDLTIWFDAFIAGVGIFGIMFLALVIASLMH